MRLAMEKLKIALESKWLIAPLFSLMLVFQILGLYNVNVLILALTLSLIFIICDDVKNIFAIIFYVSFFIGNIFESANWTFYGIAIGIACLSFIYFTVIKVIFRLKAKEKFNVSRIFIPLLIISVFYSVGGIFSNFSFVPFLVTVGFSLVVLFFIFIATNYTKNLKDYLLFAFTVGAITISLIMFITNAVKAKSILAIFSLYAMYSHPSIGAQNVNVAALFILIGMISTFGLGFNKKNGYLYLLLATALVFSIVTTSCRMIIGLAVVSFLPLAIFSLVKTPYKKSYAITCGAILLGSSAFLFLELEFLQTVLSFVLYKSDKSRFFSGRLEIWSWCLDRFIEFPLFGFGFVSKNFPIDSNPSGIILAHNTLIQWLVSMGALGTLAMLFFSFCKYRIAISSIKRDGIFMPFILLIIALSGLTDQAAQMDIFVYSLTLVALVSIDDCSSFKSLFSFKKAPNYEPLSKNLSDTNE